MQCFQRIFLDSKLYFHVLPDLESGSSMLEWIRFCLFKSQFQHSFFAWMQKETRDIPWVFLHRVEKLIFLSSAQCLISLWKVYLAYILARYSRQKLKWISFSMLSPHPSLRGGLTQILELSLQWKKIPNTRTDHFRIPSIPRRPPKYLPWNEKIISHKSKTSASHEVRL